MKQLRETIRRLILENQQHHEKLAVMIMTGDIANINQAVELAETMGYISDVNYTEGSSHYFPEYQHTWKFVASMDFMDELSKQFPQEMPKGFSFYSPNYKDVQVRVSVPE